MKEVIIHGRGGQGAVTAAQLLAIAAFYDGKQSQAFPYFGIERRCAPVQAFVRFSDKKIRTRSQVYEPDYVIVLDPSLANGVDLTSGLKKNGAVIINTTKNIKFGNYKVYKADALSIALEIFKTDIVNTAMVAAFAHFTKEVSKESVIKALSDVFKGELIEKNTLVIKKMFGALK